MLIPWTLQGERTKRVDVGVAAPARNAVGREPSVSGVNSSVSLDSTESVDALPVLHLMVLDDDPSVLSACMEIARTMGFAVIGAENVTQARGLLKHQKIDVLLMDLRLPGGSGLPLLEEVKHMHPGTAVIVMTASATVSSAVQAMRIGAGDYLTKPFQLDELMEILERARGQMHFDLESRRLREKMRNQRGLGHLIGRSPEMEKLYRIMSKVAHTTHPVLIQGETGTGKELVGRSIHFNGLNAQTPFVPVDCASLVPGLIEAELFGYARGAFAGATRSKDGLLTMNEGGTVFLDEIGEMPLELQAKLLQALQQKAVQPLGTMQSVPISVRVIAASSRDLPAMVEQGRFRKDLYFRLNVVSLKIPALRNRKDDIPPLLQHFLDRHQRENEKVHEFSNEALSLLMGYEWPGNVRELEYAVERACSINSGQVLQLDDLPSALKEYCRQGRSLALAKEQAAEVDVKLGKVVPISEMERSAILDTIRKLNGDKLMAAKLLGIGKTTLYRKLKEYGVDTDE